MNRQQRLDGMIYRANRRLDRVMRLKRRPRWLIEYLMMLRDDLRALSAK